MNELLCIDGLLFITTVSVIVFMLRRRPPEAEISRTDVRAFRTLIVYAIIVFTFFTASLFLEGGYTMAGAILYGTILGGLHTLAMGSIFIAVRALL